MLKDQISRSLLLMPLVLLLGSLPGWAHGDKVIPQVFDGGGVGRTKFDFTNLSPEFPITKVSVQFFRQDGSPWTITTNQGTGTSFNLNLGPFQTTRIETTGASPSLTVGYAVVRNTERTTQFAEDFEVAITVFFEILNGPNVVDTVSVPVGQPTVSFSFPVEMDNAANLFTGFAIVNLTDADNNVALWLYDATTSGTSIPPPDSGMVKCHAGCPAATITVPEREQPVSNQDQIQRHAAGLCVRTGGHSLVASDHHALWCPVRHAGPCLSGCPATEHPYVPAAGAPAGCRSPGIGLHGQQR